MVCTGGLYVSKLNSHRITLNWSTNYTQRMVLQQYPWGTIVTKRILFSRGYFTKCVPMTTLHCKKRHFVPKRYFYLHQKEMQDIYLLQSIFVGVKHNLFLIQIIANSLNNITDISLWYKIYFFECTLNEAIQSLTVFGINKL